MKLNIEKLQTGGGMPFTVYQPRQYHTANPYLQGLNTMRAERTQLSAGSQKGGAGGGLDLLPTQVVSELMKKGLPTDINAFLREARNLEQSGPFNANTSRSNVYELAALANQAIFNRTNFDSASKEADKNGSNSEVAFSANSGLYVQDEEGQVKHVSLAEFSENRDSYAPMTIGQLQEARAYDTKAAWDTNMIQTISQSVGTSAINKQLLEIMQTMGSTETSQEQYVQLGQMLGGLETPSSKEKSGLEVLAAAYDQSPSDAVVKIKNSSKHSNVQEAAKYIWKILPKNSKNTLIGNWVLSGGNPDDSVESILASALETRATHSDTQTVEFVKPSATAANARDKQHAQTPLEQFFDGNINQDTFQLTDSNYKNRYGMTLNGNTLAAISLDSGKGVSTAPLSIALDGNGRGMGKYLDYSKIYYGNKKITQASLQGLMYNGQTIAQTWLPVDQQGDIDFSLMGLYGGVQESLKEQGILSMPNSPEKISIINTAYANSGLPIRLDSTGKPTGESRVGQFLMLHAYAEDDSLYKGNNLIREIKGNEESQLNDLMASTYEAYKLKSPVSMFNDAYIAPVFIKINRSAAMDARTYANHGSQVTANSLEDNMLRQQLQNPTDNPIMAESSALYSQQ